jgi:hypothetical protein
MMSALQSSKHNFTITQSGEGNKITINNWRGATNGTGSGGTISWSSSNTSGGPNTAGGTSRPAYIGLAHELGHAYFAAKGTALSGDWFTVTTESSTQKVQNTDKQAIHLENLIRAENGEHLRTHYQPEYENSRVLYPSTNTSMYFFLPIPGLLVPFTYR